MRTSGSAGAVALALCLSLPASAREALVGPGVGSADALMAEGSKLYNQKKYEASANAFLKAARANPGAPAVYLGLGRSLFASKQLGRACYAYRVFLKAAPDTPDRAKAQAESDLCERQLKSAKKKSVDPSPKYVEGKAAFFAALEARRILGAGSAGEQLRALIKDGFVGPELGEMAAKLAATAKDAADELHSKAIAGENVSGERMRSARGLYELANELGGTVGDVEATFLEGKAEMEAGDFKKAESLFAAAAAGAPSVGEYKFQRAMALYRQGDGKGALAAMESDLPADPRTAVLRAALALRDSAEAGSAELEELLFSRRFVQSQGR